MVGDAAHPMTPNLGQGGCVALEVCYCGLRCYVRKESRVKNVDKSDFLEK